MIFDAAGNLYGAAVNSYGYAGGTVFKLKHGTWTEDVLYSFPSSGQDGSNPYAGLIFDKKGNLYGTTEMGGADGSGCGDNGCGTVFRLMHGTWTEEVLHSFTGGSDGAGPAAGLIFDTKGNLYGTTETGGGSTCFGGGGCGVVFEITP